MESGAQLSIKLLLVFTSRNKKTATVVAVFLLTGFTSALCASRRFDMKRHYCENIYSSLKLSCMLLQPYQQWPLLKLAKKSIGLTKKSINATAPSELS